MSFSKCLTTLAFASVVSAAPACTDRAVDDTKKDANAAIDATKAGADKLAEKSKEVASATGAAVTDGWITTKVKAKFADEKILNGSDISVDTTDHVVTLKGTVPSGAGKERAVEIAGGTEGVTRVVNALVVK
jgi:hyperosmotically inducible protein